METMIGVCFGKLVNVVACPSSNVRQWVSNDYPELDVLM